ncbi:PREDICTED: polycomb group protein EMBRYONIC FLOWER 2 isoform X2 [Lupinus angustifolius]|uniref:polycomb group protein EMBRYONIC FLOWER 2 isoform X2 n=1 Tax=Lupinus angustifolius TaxID=3871 RepID=UPI00092E6544|nr:PREDICTED: polycomb group protein EMBRYONIC FLOWER 2 isoform X2 [Lupinus angustifolius]
MPGIPVSARENLYHPDAFEHLSTEEELVAEESLSIYCRPVELYNIIQRRAISNPSFLQRCLHYKIKAKHKRRIQMTVSLSRTVTESQTVIPLYICMARLVSDVRVPENSAVYRISRIFMFRNPPGTDSNIQVQAKFTLPEVNKLAVEARSDSIAILFVSTVENSNSSLGVNASLVPTDLASSDSTAGEYYLCGKVSLESLYMAWDSSPNFHLGQRAEIRSTVDLLPCILKSDFQNEETSIFVHVPCNSEIVSMPKRIQITISAEEFGAQEKSPFHTYAGSEVPSTSLSHIIRLREGNVMFNYRYYKNKLQRTEVTEDFSCPFCLVRCASFKGLRYHLPSSHDLFNFEFWVSEECQAVNVSVKTNIWRSEIVGEGIDPKLQTFFFCAKPRKRRRPKILTLKNAKDVLETDFPARDTELLEKDDGLSATIIPSHPDPDCVLSVSEYDIGTPAVLQFAKTRKLSIEHSDPRNCALLRKRQFFHSHRAQPMPIEQVLSDQDSENEIDDDVADLEDRKMLDNFVDVSKDEKQIMHMWNSFVRKQRVLADGHIPWACEAFSNLHATELDGSTSLAWCWRLFMIKLWNHGLLDAKTMNDCNVVLEQYKKLNTNPKT